MPAHRTLSSPLVALRLLAWLPLLGLLALLAAPVRAGNLPGELPALVGRLNVLTGDLQLQDRDSGRWEGSASGDAGPLRNWPVAEGDRLRLRGRDARAELRIGSTTVRLGAGAELWLQQLDAQSVVLQLQDGSIAVRLAATDGDAFGPVEMRTSEGRWLPRRPGHYRLDRESDATQAGVWRGELQFEGFDSALTIPEGRRADLWLDKPNGGRRAATRYAWAQVQRDGFADWVARDERQDDAPQSARYVPPGITGWQDLDQHGDWIDDNDQGPLWLPRVSAGWAPFQVGRWAWVSPWGWTWIDAAPWGFAPFHYGNWLRVDGRWAWSPGRGEPHWRGHRDPRVRYSPALSAWIGGPSVGITVQIGGQRPPPPRVVVPSVPVVVRPGHGWPRPAVVAPVRPDRSWNDRHVDERRWEDRRQDDRHHDERRWDDRRDGHRGEWRNDAPGERRGDAGSERRFDGRSDQVPGRPHAERPVERPLAPVAPVAPLIQPPTQAPEQPRMTVPRPQPRVPQAAAAANEAMRAPERNTAPVERVERGERVERVERAERPERTAPLRPERGEGEGRRGGPGRAIEREQAR